MFQKTLLVLARASLVCGVFLLIEDSRAALPVPRILRAVVDDPVIHIAAAFFAALFLLALWPSGGQLHKRDQCRLPPAHRQSICQLGPKRARSSAFPELESSWFAQRSAWFSQAMKRIRL